MLLYQARRVLLIALMLFGFVVLITGTAAPAMAATRVLVGSSYCCTGEYNCGDTCPPADPTPPTVVCTTGSGHFHPRVCRTVNWGEWAAGLRAGRDAKANGGSPICPPGNTVDFCNGYSDGYDTGIGPGIGR